MPPYRTITSNEEPYFIHDYNAQQSKGLSRHHYYRITTKIPPLPLPRVFKNWCLRNKGLLLLLTLILGSIALAFINSRR
ncbi:hypothetical protein [Microcystis sp. LE19-10.1B]|jgi:Tfp pilus assembly ATPase PilU|uniref:hypothetical protein n=1 Tax=Microcystis sp. LE19-10.1B TaxID=3016428 RepID=UPI0025836A3D|nr:hypothetical protein [Microcystis sp. LE19-10.1B]